MLKILIKKFIYLKKSKMFRSFDFSDLLVTWMLLVIFEAELLT